MFAVALLVAHKLRAGWRAWAALAVIVAIAGGVVLAAAAGASRTNSAYPRFLAQSRASDVLESPASSGDLSYDTAVAALPGVAASAGLVGINAVPVNAKGAPVNDAEMVASLDGRYGREVDVPKMLAGRLPSQDVSQEIAVDLTGAQQLNLHVGSVLRMAALDSSNHARPFTTHVVGLFVTRGSIVPVNYLGFPRKADRPGPDSLARHGGDGVLHAVRAAGGRDRFIPRHLA